MCELHWQSTSGIRPEWTLLTSCSFSWCLARSLPISAFNFWMLSSRSNTCHRNGAGMRVQWLWYQQVINPSTDIKYKEVSFVGKNRHGSGGRRGRGEQGGWGVSTWYIHDAGGIIFTHLLPKRALKVLTYSFVHLSDMYKSKKRPLSLRTEFKQMCEMAWPSGKVSG